MLENDSPGRLSNINIVASDYESALGFYQWPLSWNGRFNHGQTFYTVAFELHERKTFANWVLGGFSMGIVTGTISMAGKNYKVYGLGGLLI